MCVCGGGVSVYRENQYSWGVIMRDRVGFQGKPTSGGEFRW